MREIKLKAWDKKRKCWLNDLVMDVTPNSPRVWKQTMRGKGIVFDWPDVELVQYTGLKDQNGEEIYAGDFVKNIAGNIGHVVWSPGYGCWDVLYANNSIFPISQLGQKEIIGNIYENPELTEAANA